MRSGAVGSGVEEACNWAMWVALEEGEGASGSEGAGTEEVAGNS